MSLRTAIVGVGLAGGIGLGSAVTAQPGEPEAVPVPVVRPVSLEETLPPADPPALPPIAPVSPPTQVPELAKSTGKLTPSPAPKSTPDALPRMLAEARTAYARLRDYSCHYIRQERVSGRLVPEESCELRVRTNPFCVSVRVTGPKEYANRESVYIASLYHGTKVKFKDTNKLSYVVLPLNDPKVMADTRHVITDVGLAAVLDRVENAVRVEKQAGNPVEVVVSDFTFAGRPCTRYEVFAERSHAMRYAHRHVLYIDKQTKLPVRYEAYDNPSAGGPTGGEMIEVQSFVGMRVNTGLGEAAFDR